MFSLQYYKCNGTSNKSILKKKIISYIISYHTIYRIISYIIPYVIYLAFMFPYAQCEHKILDFQFGICFPLKCMYIASRLSSDVLYILVTCALMDVDRYQQREACTVTEIIYKELRGRIQILTSTKLNNIKNLLQVTFIFMFNNLTVPIMSDRRQRVNQHSNIRRTTILK